MKKLLLATSAMVLVSTTLTGAYCSKCSRGYHRAPDRSQHLNTVYNSRSPLGKDDHYLTENDRHILQAVKSELRNNDVAADNIQVFVEYGKVVLDGSVPSTEAKEDLQQYASNVEGVRHVIMDVYVDEKSNQNNRNRNSDQRLSQNWGDRSDLQRDSWNNKQGEDDQSRNNHENASQSGEREDSVRRENNRNNGRGSTHPHDRNRPYNRY